MTYHDTQMLEQVLINLLKNAEQALADTPGARVDLSGKLNKRGHVVIEIEDNGPGVPEEIQERVFDAFFTTKEQGTGLGLAIAHKIVQSHEGFIKASRNDHRGSTFCLYFPYKNSSLPTIGSNEGKEMNN